MPAHHYRLTSEWRVDALPHEVADVFRDPGTLPQWWPEVFLDARVVDEGRTDGAGRAAQVRTKGWMPHVLRFRFVVLDVGESWGFRVRAEGDFLGRGSCTFTVEGDATVLRFEWDVEVRHPFVRLFSWLLKPLFVSNHRWAMRRGLEGLTRALARPRASFPVRLPMAA